MENGLYEYDKASGHYFCKCCGNNYLTKTHKDYCSEMNRLRVKLDEVKKKLEISLKENSVLRKENGRLTKELDKRKKIYKDFEALVDED